MRVLVVSPWEPWRTCDGVVLVLHHHLRELAARHDITVVAGGSPASREQRVDGAAAAVPDGVSVRWLGTGRPAALDYLVRRLRSEVTGEPAHAFFVQRRALVAAVREEAARSDVVHLVGWGTAGLAGVVAPVPAVHFAVDPWQANLANRALPWWRRVSDAGQRRKVRAHERRHYPEAASVVVVSADDATSLRAEIPSARVRVVPNGVEPGGDPVPLPAAAVLGFHGAFEARHNVDGARALVERILPLVRQAVPDATALVVGRDVPPVVGRLRGAGVEVLGCVPDIRAEIDRMTVYVAWMTSGAGIKNKVLEAMAAGRPVVTNARGASGIGAGEGVVVVDDEAAAAAEVARLLGDRAAATAAGAANRERVLREFTWSASARGIEAVWREAAG